MVLGEADRGGMLGQIVQTLWFTGDPQQPEHALADRELTHPTHRFRVHPGVHERGQGAIGCPYPQRPVACPGHAHRRADDPVQCGVEFQIRADFDRYPQQLRHLIARRDQFLELLVHPADELGPGWPESGRLSANVAHASDTFR